jgi:hypothetical protein
MIPPQHHGALPGRRTVLHGALLTATSALSATHLAGCSPSSPRSGTPTASQSNATTGSKVKRVLLAYFSRPGENYYYGGRTDLKVGNTEVLAEKIADRISCDTYRIQAVDPYPHDYDATVQRNVREQDTDARPAIEGRLPSLNGYDTILLASPIWNVHPSRQRSCPLRTTARSAVGTWARWPPPCDRAARAGRSSGSSGASRTGRRRHHDAAARAVGRPRDTDERGRLRSRRPS